jgi:transcription initiation factor TFIIIB Brf1 subunit/transcription initiation factor TFIIB
MPLPPSRTTEWSHAEELLEAEEFRRRLDGETPSGAFMRHENPEKYKAGEWPAVKNEDLYDTAEHLTEVREYVVKFVDQLVDSKAETGSLMYDALLFADEEKWDYSSRPDTAAAGAIRLAEDYAPLDITNKKIAEIADRSPKTVRRAYKEAKEELGFNH